MPPDTSAQKAPALPIRLPTRRRCLIVAGVWAAVAALLFVVDGPLAHAVNDTPLSQVLSSLGYSPVHVLRWPGVYYFTLAVSVLIGFLWPRTSWRGSVLLCLTGLLSGLFYLIPKWLAGRPRPYTGGVLDATEFHPFHGGIAGLFNAPNQSFPSGHACLAFASAATLTMLQPRWWPLFYGVAVVTALERVLQGAHYPSDVAAGAGLGILAAFAMAHLSRGLWPAAQPGALPEIPPAR